MQHAAFSQFHRQGEETALQKHPQGHRETLAEPSKTRLLVGALPGGAAAGVPEGIKVDGARRVCWERALAERQQPLHRLHPRTTNHCLSSPDHVIFQALGIGLLCSLQLHMYAVRPDVRPDISHKALMYFLFMRCLLCVHLGPPPCLHMWSVSTSGLSCGSMPAGTCGWPRRS